MDESDFKENIIPIDISAEVQKSYLDYAMSVIAGRALPDARDGLKPVHRRVLWAMNQMGLAPNKRFVKSAQVVGKTMGEFHPHGDAAIYDTLVRLAQDFSMRYPLVDPQGNFGTSDDRPASMRYTECRLKALALDMVRDIDQGTVDFAPNYDGSKQEPTVLPTRFPNLLLNGVSGIAVGMATNIPSHNITEIMNGLLHLLDHPEAELEDLMKFIPGPDFATGGEVIGVKGIKEAYATGRGKLRLRGLVENEEGPGRVKLVVKELPYGVSKGSFIDKIKSGMRDKIITEISAMRDESSEEDGLRLVIELKAGAVQRVLINKLYKHTPLQSTFGVNAIALVHGQPQTLSLKEMLRHYLDHLIEVELRRAVFELDKVQARIHLLEGYIKALADIDKVVDIIRSSDNREAAGKTLKKAIGLSDIQAKSILDMQLARLTKLSVEDNKTELKELAARAEYLTTVIEDESVLHGVARDTMIEIRDQYQDERRTRLLPEDNDFNLDEESLILDEDAVVIITKGGYIKRMHPDELKAQARGGVGVGGITLNEGDSISHVTGMTLHQYILLVTDLGKMYRLKGYQLPAGSRTTKGRALVNMLPLQEGETVRAVLTTKDYEDAPYIVFYSQKGVVKRSKLSNYKTKMQADGIKSMNLADDDRLQGAVIAEEGDSFLLATALGKCLRFDLNKLRASGRTSGGVGGIKLSADDTLVGGICGKDSDMALLATDQGFGKRVPLSDYPLKGRNGSGSKGFGNVPKRGRVIGAVKIQDNDDFVLVNSMGTILRTAAENAPTQSRTSSGVKLQRLRKDASLVALSIVPAQGEGT